MANSDIDLTTVVLVLLGVLVLWPVLMMTMGGMGMMGYGYGMMGGSGGGFGLVGALLQVLLLVLVVGGGYLVVRRVLDHRADHDPALEELRQAYARGDISDEEFDQRRERLERDE
jgi:putative membrane protein